MRLTSDPEATARQLADLIERDPSLAAQVMRYARSALFNYQGNIATLQDAITRVLGFDRVAHIAMGVASTKAFNVPREGMLGLDAFWRHTLYCAYLCQRLAERLPRAAGVEPGLAYLCGLLHNFGLLLIGHLFPSELRLLGKLREANPDLPMMALERQVFGQGAQELISVGHGAIGGILLKLWQLPEPVIKSAGLHQQPDYQGDCASYVWTVRLANALLKPAGVGDEFDAEDTGPLCQRLGLTAADLDAVQTAMSEVTDELDVMAHALLA